MRNKIISIGILCMFVLYGFIGLYIVTTPVSAGGLQEDAPWPVFRGNIRQTGLSPYDTGNNTGNLKWKFETEKTIESSPVIDNNGTIYVGSDDYNFYALYPNGTLKWKYYVGREVTLDPAIDTNGIIYFGSGLYLYAFYPNGNLKWKNNIGSSSMDSAPMIGEDGTIYIGSKGYLNAVYPNGSLKWRYGTRSAAVSSSPAIDAYGTLYFGSHNYFYAVYPNGTLKWEFTTKETTQSSPALGLDGSIYFGGDYYLFALYPNGSLKWKYQMAYPVHCSPAIGSDGTIYTGPTHGALYAMNPNGTVKWQCFINPGYSSPAIGADGTIYIGTYDTLPGYVYAIYPNGTIKWKFETEERINSAPAIDANGTVYASSLDWYIYAIGTSNCGENLPPVADAGPDQNTTVNKTVFFDGSGSYDPNKVALSYKWDFGDGTSSGWISDCNVTRKYTITGDYTVTLTVSDGLLFDSDSCIIHVHEDDEPPVADAGPDQIVDQFSDVTFDGSSSTDNMGIDKYTWTFTYYDFERELYGITPQFTFDIPGVYTVGLTVRDYAGFEDTDAMIVTVRDIVPPTANAGPDQVVDQYSVVIFNGSNSTDNVGIYNYTWTFTYDDLEMELYGKSPQFNFDISEVFIVILTVEDSEGLTDTDTMTVSVLEILPPIADAGEDQIINQNSEVAFNGSGQAVKGEIANYTWKFSYDGIERELYGADPRFSFNIPGVYTIVLIVEDEYGNLGFDTLTVTVLDIEPPVANASVDQIVEIGTGVVFDGSGSTDNIGIDKYLWTFNYDDLRMELWGINPNFRFYFTGSYVVTLNVSDAAGNWDTDTVTVNVWDTEPPVADAGPDQKIMANQFAYFNGGISTDNSGEIANYTWTFTYNDTAITLYGADTGFKFEKAGLYEVTLTVWDPSNNYASETMRVNVTNSESDDGDIEPDDKEPFYLPWWIFLILVVVIIILFVALYINKGGKTKSEEMTSTPTEQNTEIKPEQPSQQPDEESLPSGKAPEDDLLPLPPDE